MINGTVIKASLGKRLRQSINGNGADLAGHLISKRRRRSEPHIRFTSKAYSRFIREFDQFRREKFKRGIRGNTKRRNGEKLTINDEFRKDPKATAQKVLYDQKANRSKPVKRASVLAFYKGLWCRDAKFDPKMEHSSVGDFEMIKEVELRECLKTLKTKSSSGFDNMRPAMFKSFLRTERGTEATLNLFNTILKYGHIPAGMRKARVTLIPKVEGAEDLAKFRPISVHNVAYRVFSSLIDKRLKLTATEVIGSYQHALREGENACATAASTIKAAIKNEWRANRSLYICSLDVAKAFDTVAHKAIYNALEDAKVPLYLRRVLLSSLVSERVFKCSDGLATLKTTCGVAQGLAHSATLFVLALDKVKGEVERGGLRCLRGKNLTGDTMCTISGAAYMDDLIVCDSDKGRLEERVKGIFDVCKGIGLRINSEKSMYFGATRMRNKKKDYVVDSEPLNVGEGSVRVVHSMKYLGITLSLRKHKYCWKTRLSTLLGRVKNADLSIRNKIEMIKTYVIPKLIYGLSQQELFGNNSHRQRKSRLYSDLDALLRKTFRSILKLGDESMPINYYHMQESHGGLGVPSFQDILPAARYKIASTFTGGIRDLVVNNLFLDVEAMNGWQVEMFQKEPQERREAQKLEHMKSFRLLGDGRGNWVEPDKKFEAIRVSKFSGSSFVGVARLRAGVIGNKPSAPCRTCGKARETVAHLTSIRECSSETQLMWEKRHDHTVRETYEFINRTLKNKNHTFANHIEKEFKIGENKYRPDIVTVNKTQKIILVFEVQVTNATSVTFRSRVTTKTQRYEPHLNEFRNALCVEENVSPDEYKIGFVPLVVSMYGQVYPYKNRRLVEKFGFKNYVTLIRVVTTFGVKNSALYLKRLLDYRNDRALIPAKGRVFRWAKK